MMPGSFQGTRTSGVTGCGGHGLEALHHRLVVLHAVLHIDGDAVPAALRHHFGREAGRDGEPAIDGGLARFQSLLELVRHRASPDLQMAATLGSRQ